MQTRPLKQFTFNITNGTPNHRLRFAEEVIPVLRQELNRLRDKAESQCREFASTLAAWTSQPVGELLRPVTIEQDLREARLLNVIAVLLTLTELALTFFISLLFAISAPFLVMLALVAIFALKVGLLAVWRNPQQPQQTRRRLRRWVIAPSLAVTVASLMVLFLARSAGPLALLLLPIVSLAIFSLSMGCLGLAAGLFALGYLMSWSRHAEKRFNALEREAVETRRVLQQVERVVEELKPANRRGDEAVHQRIASEPASSTSALQTARSAAPLAESRKSTSHSGKRAGFVSWLVLVAALWGGGCGLQDGVKPVTATQAATVADGAAAASPSASRAAEGLLLEIWLDWSLSAEDQPYREAARSLVAALPELAVKYGVARVVAYRFGERGWSAAEIFSLDLPLPQTAAPEESTIFYGNIKSAQDEEADKRRRDELRQALAGVTPERLLPANVAEPPCTDVRGVLIRIAETPRPQCRLVFLISDLADTCSHRLQPVSLAAANAALVAVVLPEAPPDSTQRKAQPTAQLLPDQLWKQRRVELQQATPGAIVIPYFGDPVAAASEALSKLRNQPNN